MEHVYVVAPARWHYLAYMDPIVEKGRPNVVHRKSDMTFELEGKTYHWIRTCDQLRGRRFGTVVILEEARCMSDFQDILQQARIMSYFGDRS